MIIPPNIPPPSLKRHGFSFIKVQISLYVMLNFTRLYLLSTPNNVNIMKS